METCKLSVIVPVFNGEQYIARCLDSLLTQGLSPEHYEILCVDDGSTDGSAELLSLYQQRCPQFIHVFRKPNTGVAETRNFGIEKAEGDLITFCDCDDYIIPNAYKYLLETFWDDGVDVLRFNPVTLDRAFLKKWKENNDPTGIVLYEGCGREVFQHPFFASANTHIYRKSFLSALNLRIPRMTMDEDRVFNLHVYMSNPKVKVVTSCVYRYTVNSDQTTTNRDADKMKSILPDFISEFEYCNRYIAEFESSDHALSSYLSGRRYFRTTAFFSRMLSARLSQAEWKSYVNRLRDIGWIPLPYGGKIAVCVRLICSSYYVYFMASVCNRFVFEPFILPRLSRN